MFHIRPHQVLNLVNPQERKFLMWLPTSGWAMTTLETSILVALLKLTKPRNVFEFGTFHGETTRILAANMGDPDGKIFTLDLEKMDGVVFEGRDKILAEEAVASKRPFEDPEYAARIKQLLDDSMLFDFAKFAGQINFVLVDGNHNVNYVKKDTQNAMLMLTTNESACMVWHDYGNPHHPDLTRYLNDLSNEIPLYHVEETMLVFYTRGLELQNDWQS